MDDTMLTELSAKASAVATMAADTEAAFDEQGDAEIEVLRKVLERVRPSLKAIVGKVTLSKRVANLTRNGDIPPDSFVNYDRRAVRILGSGPNRECERDTRGPYSGEALYLREDGEFVEFSYGGEWSNWQSESSRWEAEVRQLSLRDVVDEYELEEVVAGIVEKLDKQLKGKAPERAKAARERAEKLRALAALL